MPISHLRAYHDCWNVSVTWTLIALRWLLLVLFYRSAQSFFIPFKKKKKISQGLSYALMLHENISELLILFTEQENHFLPSSNSAWSAAEALPALLEQLHLGESTPAKPPLSSFSSFFLFSLLFNLQPCHPVLQAASMVFPFILKETVHWKI